MKKLFVIAAVALSLGTFSSCNNGSNCAVEHDPKVDTLTACFGEMYGYGISGQTKEDSTFNKKDFLKGLQAAMQLGEDKQSYAQGMQFGMQIKATLAQIKEREQVDMNAKKWLAAFKKAFMDDSIQDPNTYQMQVMELLKECSANAKQNNPKAIANKKMQEKFIADSLANNEAVKKSSYGIYYKVIAEGEGESFKQSDRIMLKYVGRHLDGTEFDSSRGEVIPMSPMSVIKGFGEGLQMMKPGAKYILYIPCELGYGVDGAGPVEPNEMLIFEVETVGLESAE